MGKRVPCRCTSTTWRKVFLSASGMGHTTSGLERRATVARRPFARKPPTRRAASFGARAKSAQRAARSGLGLGPKDPEPAARRLEPSSCKRSGAGASAMAIAQLLTAENVKGTEGNPSVQGFILRHTQLYFRKTKSESGFSLALASKRPPKRRPRL